MTTTTMNGLIGVMLMNDLIIVFLMVLIIFIILDKFFFRGTHSGNVYTIWGCARSESF